MDEPTPSFTLPTLETERLLLRAFTRADAAEVKRLAGDPAIFATTLSIPHPYRDGMAEQWIDSHPALIAAGTLFPFAITARDGGALVGTTGLTRNPEHEHAEIGYWIGKPFWHRGFATEAARAVLDWGLRTLPCERYFGRCFVGNPASRRVLEKLGMRYEGCMRKHIRKPGGARDVELFGLLRDDWRAATSA